MRDATEDAVFERRGGGFEPIFVDDSGSDTEWETSDAADSARPQGKRVSLQPEEAGEPEAKRPANAGATVKAEASASRDLVGTYFSQMGQPIGSPATKRSRSPSASRMRRKSCCLGSSGFRRPQVASPSGLGPAWTVSCVYRN